VQTTPLPGGNAEVILKIKILLFLYLSASSPSEAINIANAFTFVFKVKIFANFVELIPYLCRFASLKLTKLYLFLPQNKDKMLITILFTDIINSHFCCFQIKISTPFVSLNLKELLAINCVRVHFLHNHKSVFDGFWRRIIFHK